MEKEWEYWFVLKVETKKKYEQMNTYQNVYERDYAKMSPTHVHAQALFFDDVLQFDLMMCSSNQR